MKIYFALMHLHPLDVRITYRGTPGSDVQDAEELTLSTMAQLNDARYERGARWSSLIFVWLACVLGLCRVFRFEPAIYPLALFFVLTLLDLAFCVFGPSFDCPC